MSAASASVSLEEVLITSELVRRSARPPDHAAENRALSALAASMAESPKDVFQQLADCALALCRAGSAGVSVWEPGGEEVFRWRATAGEYAPYVGGTLPRHFSPCGVVLDRNACLLMADPVRFFPYIAELSAPVREVLLVPFYQGQTPVGTVWVVAHDAQTHFDAEDARIVTSLTQFAGAAIAALSRIEAAELAERLLREADRKKDDFIATLAHELRNPLAPVSTGVSLLGEAKDPELSRKTLGVMRRQVDHMVRLIDDLLDVSRITRGKLELRRERIALADILEAAIEGSQLHLDRGDHELRTSLSAEPLYLHADRTRMAQVIGNLLHNASKFTPHEGEIELTTRREGDEVVIAVRDSGMGIARERLEDVFEMFSQVNRTLDRAHGGLGIGLALVRRLVQMHGGSVSAFSDGLGRGSTFTVRLPLAREEPAPAALHVDAPPALAAGTRVLVVDDNEDAAELLALALESAGCAAAVAHDGPAAIAAAEQALPRVVILDIGLPGMSGYELAQHFRRDARFAHTVFIALTGWGSQEDRRRALAAGFDVHLTKPVSARDLQQALGRAATLRASGA